MSHPQNKKSWAVKAALIAAIVMMAAGLPNTGWAQNLAGNFPAATVASEYFALAAKCPSGICPDEATARRANRLSKLAPANCYAAYGAEDASKASACQTAVATFPAAYTVGGDACPAGQVKNKAGICKIPRPVVTDDGKKPCSITGQVKINGVCKCPEATPFVIDGECACPTGQTFADDECGCHENGKPYYDSNTESCEACSEAYPNSLPYWDGINCTKCPTRTMWDGTTCTPCESGANWMPVASTDIGRCITCNTRIEKWDNTLTRCVPLNRCPDGTPEVEGKDCSKWSPSHIGWYPPSKDPDGKLGFWGCPQGYKETGDKKPFSSCIQLGMLDKLIQRLPQWLQPYAGWLLALLAILLIAITTGLLWWNRTRVKWWVATAITILAAAILGGIYMIYMIMSPPLTWWVGGLSGLLLGFLLGFAIAKISWPNRRRPATGPGGGTT